MYKTLSFLVLTIGAFFVCSSFYKSKQEVIAKTQQTKPSSTPKADPGKIVYMKYCFACHQMDGSGVQGMYPPIQKTSWASGDKTRLIKLLLEGMKGPIEVNGDEYDQSMPTHKFLTDQQVADVLTYIRKNFGNKADAVSVTEVAKVRKTIKNY